MYIKHIQDFMDSKGYQHVGTIEIDDIFLKKRLMKKWNMSKIPVKKVGSMSCSVHVITKIQFQITNTYLPNKSKLGKLSSMVFHQSNIISTII